MPRSAVSKDVSRTRTANNWWPVKSLRLRADGYAGKASFASRSASWATARGDWVIGAEVFRPHWRL